MFPHWITRAPIGHWTVCGDVVGELEDDIDELEPVNEPVGDRAESNTCSHQHACDRRSCVGVASVVGSESHRSCNVVFVAQCAEEADR